MVRLLCSLTAVLAIPVSAHAVETWDWNQRIDTGNYILEHWTKKPTNGTGSYVYSYVSGDAGWWKTWHNVQEYEYEVISQIGKSSVHGQSPTYPKLVDSTQKNLWCSASWAWSDWGMYNRANSCVGVYLWTDDSNPATWVFTNEIMIWEQTHGRRPNPWDWATYIGKMYQDGSDYECFTFANPDGNRSYVIMRVNQRSSGWLDVKGILNWLRNPSRGQHRLQNHYIVNMQWVVDTICAWPGDKAGGEHIFSDIRIPNL